MCQHVICSYSVKRLPVVITYCEVHSDKGDLAAFYAVSRELLTNLSLLQASFSQGSASYMNDIIHYYAAIISALHSVELLTVPRIPHTALKPFWNEHVLT